MNKEYNEIIEKLKKDLADFLGIEVDDIEDEYSLTEDLHMKPTDLTDFTEELSKKGYPTENLNFTEIETFNDLADFFIQHQ